MTEIKICGITDREEGLFAAACGVEALGFIFHLPSPRYIDPRKAREIIAALPAEVVKVGVFVNLPAPAVQQIVDFCGLDLIQLHGDETPEYCRQFASSRLIKAVCLQNQEDLTKLERYRTQAILVDARTADKYGGTGKRADWGLAALVKESHNLILSGGLNEENIAAALTGVAPPAVDLNSGVESTPGRKDREKVRRIVALIRAGLKQEAIKGYFVNSHKKREHMNSNLPDKNGHFGLFGGRYAAETLMPALLELETAYCQIRRDKVFQAELNRYLQQYAGRETPLYLAQRLTEKMGGAKIYLKREDLNHTGSHKINNTLGQALLARKMGKKKLIAETGAGQHGVATATVAALFGMECRIFMGEEDIRRQAPNVFRMKILGAEVVPVSSGTATLKDAMNEAMRQWVSQVSDTYYVIGSTAGPHPYPLMVRDFQSVIGRETKEQILRQEGRSPDVLVACVGGGSNSMGLFYPFRNMPTVAMVGVEAAGEGIATGLHAVSIGAGRVGVLHGNKTYLLQDEFGQIRDAYSLAAGLDYPGVGPEHSYFHTTGRAKYVAIDDEEAVGAFMTLSKLEGIIPALESAHAVAYAMKLAPTLGKEKIVVVNLSGRGDKDAETIIERMKQP